MRVFSVRSRRLALWAVEVAVSEAAEGFGVSVQRVGAAVRKAVGLAVI